MRQNIVHYIVELKIYLSEVHLIYEMRLLTFSIVKSLAAVSIII